MPLFPGLPLTSVLESRGCSDRSLLRDKIKRKKRGMAEAGRESYRAFEQNVGKRKVGVERMLRFRRNCSMIAVLSEQATPCFRQCFNTGSIISFKHDCNQACVNHVFMILLYFAPYNYIESFLRCAFKCDLMCADVFESTCVSLYLLGL